MKTYITYITSILFAACFFTSCDDFLTQENLTQKSTENFPATEQEANELVTGMYANLRTGMPEASYAIAIAQLAGDDCLGGNLETSLNVANSLLMYTNINLYNDLYTRCFRIVNRANVAIETLDNFEKWSSKSERDRCFGEAYFLRALAFYELAQIFGPVPLRNTSKNPDMLPRAPVEEIYEQIASDLKNAIELLPNRIYLDGSPMVGHATRAAAQALMARVFLFYTGRYAKAELPGVTKAQVIAWIDDCVNNSGHALVSDQRNIWPYTYEGINDNPSDYRYQYTLNNNLKWEGLQTIETVFAIKHSLRTYSNQLTLFFSPSADNSTAESGGGYPFGRGWGQGPASPVMIEDWKAWSAQQAYLNGVTEDPRLTGSVWSYRAMNPNAPTQVIFDRRLTPEEPDYIVSYRYFEQTGYHQKKYINVMSYSNAPPATTWGIRSFGLQRFPGVATTTSQSSTSIADIILIRFADVLLMQSELKEDATGLNRVRTRSNLAPVGYSLRAIKEERRWELAFEFLRWFDLLRWSGPSLEEAGDALNKQAGFTLINGGVEMPYIQFNFKARLKEMQGYWPLPQSQIDLSNGLMEQNPGWGTAEALFTSWMDYR